MFRQAILWSIPFLEYVKKFALFLTTEVSSIIELPLSVFLNDEILIKAKMPRLMQRRSMFLHLILKDMLYGCATAMMLSELKMF
jgi:hypothetical protein